MVYLIKTLCKYIAFFLNINSFVKKIFKKVLFFGIF